MKRIRRGINLFSIDKLTYTNKDKKFFMFKTILENFSSEETNLIYLIYKDKEKTKFYIGTVMDVESSYLKESAVYNSKLIKAKFLSYYKGSGLIKVPDEILFSLNKKLYNFDERFKFTEDFLVSKIDDGFKDTLKDYNSEYFFNAIYRITDLGDETKYSHEYTIDKIINGFPESEFIIFTSIKDNKMCIYIIGKNDNIAINILNTLKEKSENLKYEKVEIIEEIKQRNFNKFTSFNPFKKEHYIKLDSEKFNNLIGLPYNDMVGIEIKKEINFGLNIKSVENENKLKIAKIMQDKTVLESEINLDQNNLTKHVFITGVTGSGKTTTCKTILKNSKLPFMIIEPAKTEYRDLINDNEDFIVFTAGENTSPLYLNPFVLQKNETIESRIGMIKGAILSSFNLEAAIAQIIEKCMYEIYKKKGWDLETSTHKYMSYGDKTIFPTFEDLIKSVEEVVENFKFSEDLKNNYIGAIISRLTVYTIGSKHKIFNTELSVNFEELIEKKVLFELDNIKDPTEKKFLIAMILVNINQAIKNKNFYNKDFKHITLIEEAHRFLSEDYNKDNSEGLVIFTDMLAEIRKYGEGLIIVDQIPNKLIKDVIKNTNTKIVHKLFSKDDKEIIGDSMMLEKEQIDYISNLDTGEAIIFSESWNKPVLAKIDLIRTKNSNENVSEKIMNNEYIKAIRFENLLYRYSLIKINQELVLNKQDYEFILENLKFLFSISYFKQLENSEKTLTIFEKILKMISRETKESKILLKYSPEILLKNLITNKIEITEETYRIISYLYK